MVCLFGWVPEFGGLTPCMYMPMVTYDIATLFAIWLLTVLLFLTFGLLIGLPASYVNVNHTMQRWPYILRSRSIMIVSEPLRSSRIKIYL